MEDMRISFERAAAIKPDNKDPRRRLERRDFNLVKEDHSAMANLPRQAQHHQVSMDLPKEGGYFMIGFD